ncbi:MAG: hypothetical protein NZ482_01830 [Gloeomargarita sp. SKYG98]|nr:hypothetical protein [Gloeomargarita sp. SKYG98]
MPSRTYLLPLEPHVRYWVEGEQRREPDFTVVVPRGSGLVGKEISILFPGRDRGVVGRAVAGDSWGISVDLLAQAGVLVARDKQVVPLPGSNAWSRGVRQAGRGWQQVARGDWGGLLAVAGGALTAVRGLSQLTGVPSLPAAMHNSAKAKEALRQGNWGRALQRGAGAVIFPLSGLVAGGLDIKDRVGGQRTAEHVRPNAPLMLILPNDFGQRPGGSLSVATAVDKGARRLWVEVNGERFSLRGILPSGEIREVEALERGGPVR